MIVQLDAIEQTRCPEPPAPRQHVAASEKELKALDPLSRQLKQALGSDLKQIERIGNTPLYAATVEREALPTLKCNPHVAKAAKERVSRSSLDKSLPSIGSDAAPPPLQAAGNGFMVAVLDSGVAAEHPFLGARVQELCFARHCPGPHDPHPAAPRTYHGTHVAGIIAGSPLDVEAGDGKMHKLRGVASQAEILAVQIFDRSDDPDECPGSDVCYVSYEASQLKALSYLAEHVTDKYPNLAAVNLSLGDGENHNRICDTEHGEKQEDFRQKYIDVLTSNGVAVVAAAGNRWAGPGVDRPACLRNVIAVAATTSEKPAPKGEPDNTTKVPTALQNGEPTDIMAPGVGVFSSTSFFGGKALYQPGTGTSVAAPHVSGAIAALRSLPSKPTLQQILDALAKGPQMPDPRFRQHFARPRLDLAAAIEVLKAQGEKTPGIVSR